MQEITTEIHECENFELQQNVTKYIYIKIDY